MAVSLGSWQPAEILDLPTQEPQEGYRRGGRERTVYQQQLEGQIARYKLGGSRGAGAYVGVGGETEVVAYGAAEVMVAGDDEVVMEVVELEEAEETRPPNNNEEIEVDRNQLVKLDPSGADLSFDFEGEEELGQEELPGSWEEEMDQNAHLIHQFSGLDDALDFSSQEEGTSQEEMGGGQPRGC